MKKVLVTYNMFKEGFAELEQRYKVTFPSTQEDLTIDEVMHVIHEYDALCPMFNFPVNKALIDKGIKLKIIANYAAGFNNIDVSYASQKEIAVANTPNAPTEPTANLALALILDVARRISECDHKLRTLGNNMKVGVLENLGLPVSGKILGIIGMGRIGKALCKRALACGMIVHYHNRHRLETNVEQQIGAHYVTFEELIATSDFISLNAPYTSETHHIIGSGEFNSMKKSAIVINTARGPLIDEKALIKALQEKQIQGAGLDMFEFGDHPSKELLMMDNVVLTPHIGTQTHFSREKMAKEVSDNVIGFFEHDRPISLVTI